MRPECCPRSRTARAGPVGSDRIGWLGRLAASAWVTRVTGSIRLRLLSALRFGGPRRPHDLGGELGVTARNVTGLVDALEHDGLVERLPHPSDRRATLVRLTVAGTAWRGSCQRS